MAEDYRDDNLTIYEMVFKRVPFLPDTPENRAILKIFIYEVMNELEPCFKISVLPDGTIDPSRVGQEEYYSMEQKSIIADVVAVYLIMIQAATNVGGTGPGGVTPLATFLSKAKAGSVEVEYDSFDVNKSVMLGTSTADLLAFYKKSAIRKAQKLGCTFDICDDCTIQFVLEGLSTAILPFRVIRGGGGCGCC